MDDSGLPENHTAFVVSWWPDRLRVEVDPQAAAETMSIRLLLPFVAMALVGLGIRSVRWGCPWTGLAVGAVGVLLPRLFKRSASGSLLARIAEDAALYATARDLGALRAVVRPEQTAFPRASSRHGANRPRA